MLAPKCWVGAGNTTKKNANAQQKRERRCHKYFFLPAPTPTTELTTLSELLISSIKSYFNSMVAC